MQRRKPIAEHGPFLLIAMLGLVGQVAPHVIAAPTGLVSQEKRSKGEIIKRLIDELYKNRWRGVQHIGTSPTTWILYVTDPLKRLLEIGPEAQDALLDKLGDPLIKDQVIVLLGGIGDEKAVGPIIDSIADDDEIDASRINLCADFALTNITTADVVWSRVGNDSILNCAENRKLCWQRWWDKNRMTFRVKNLTQRDRDYQNYPNYGIYKLAHRNTTVYYESNQ